MAKRKRTGPPKKKASERYKSVTVTMPPKMYREALKHRSVSGFLRDMYEELYG